LPPLRLEEGPMRQGRDHWFLYSRTAGRITAAPANWRGWLALVIGVLLTVAVAVGVMRLTGGFHPAVRLLALGAAILAGVLVLIRLAVRKGRPSS
jgi:membrane protein YdbS with pleckstrin-like domain